MPLPDLPHEILAIIIQTALNVAPCPSSILCVCRVFYDLGAHHLYTCLKFTSAYQLCQFAEHVMPMTAPPSRSTIVPRSFTVDLTLSPSNHITLRHVSNALVKCGELARLAEDQGLLLRDQELEGAAVVGGDGYDDNERDARLKHLRLRMHSYASDAAADGVALERGLRAVSPDTFEWTGPDPDHHFSTAIVGPVAACLFKNFSSWQHIREIVVTNISFTASSDGAGDRNSPLMTDVPSLRYLYIGQATFLEAEAVAGMFCHVTMARLEVVRLVDAYVGSIWGPRLRRSDIEKAALMSCRAEEQAAAIARIRTAVTCEKKTERIMGGDRVEGTHILD